MQQHSSDNAGGDSEFAVKCRLVQSYFNQGWNSAYGKIGTQSSGDNPRVWQQRKLVEGRWEGLFLELGYPKLTYVGNGTNDQLQVQRQVLGGRVRIESSERSDMAGRQIKKVAIEAGSGDQVFVMKVRAGLKAHLEYHALDGFLRLLWDESASFEFSGGLRDVEDLLTEHYNKEKVMLLRQLQAPHSDQMRNVRINMQALPDNNAQYMMIGVLPGRDTGSAIPQRYPLSIAYAVNLGFNENVFSNLKIGQAPVDKNWVVSLFLPKDSWRASGPTEKYEDKFHRCGYVPNNTLDRKLDAPQAQRQLNPSSEIFAVGASRILLTLSPAAATADWVLEEGALGTLEKEGADYYYKPPVKISPAAVFNENTELLIAPAYRASLPSPVRLDKVKVTVGNEVAYSTFVTHIVPPPLMIRAAKVGDQLKLTLWSFNGFEHKEVQVPENDVIWDVVAGDGVVTKEGFFTPGARSSSTITGIDRRNQEEWRWGGTIVPCPLLSVDNVVSLIQGEDSN